MTDDKMETFNCCGKGNESEESMCECIKFNGEEAQLPNNGQIRDPSLTIKDFFTNWDEAKHGIDLIVDEAMVKAVNDTYKGRGILLADPVQSGVLWTLDEWKQAFGTDGVKLWGIKVHYREKVGQGVRYRDPDQHVYAVKIGKGRG